MRPNGTVLKWRNLYYVTKKKKKTDLSSVPRETTSSSARWWWSVCGGGVQGELWVWEWGDDGIAEDNRKWGKRRPYLGRQSSGVPDLKGRQEHSQHSKGSWGVKCVCVCVCIYVFLWYRSLSVTCWWRLKYSVWKCVCVCVCVHVCTSLLNYSKCLKKKKKNLALKTLTQAVILRTHRYAHRHSHTATN